MTDITQLKQAAEPSGNAAAPVIAVDHEALLSSNDPQLEANKRFCYEMYRTVLQAGHADRVRDFIADDYIQHNPNAASGAAALEEFVGNSRPRREIEPTISLPLVSIMAERDMVTFVFVRREEGEGSGHYYTSWFDTFRLENGKIAEHWDPALQSPRCCQSNRNLSPIDEALPFQASG